MGQIELPLIQRWRWGGRRPGAGRKATGRAIGLPHRGRPAHDKREPVHVTMRVVRELPSLRSKGLAPIVMRIIGRSSGGGFRIVQFSVQGTHVHLLVEAEGRRTLLRGLRGLAVRLAMGINRALGRTGRVIADRYHARALATPGEVRRVLVYVLGNHRKHIDGLTAATESDPWSAAGGIDPWSSAAWFDGWNRALRTRERPRPDECWPAGEPPPVARARTWLAAVGWRRHGLIAPGESPLDRAR